MASHAATDAAAANGNHDKNRSPPLNLQKSVADLANLSQFDSNSFDAITCCFGYNLVDDSHLPQALSAAYRVLAPGGLIIVVNWEQSGLQYIIRDVLAAVRRGGVMEQEDYCFLPSPSDAVEPIALSGEHSAFFDKSLEDTGFQHYQSPIFASYPFNLGQEMDLQMLMGTFTIRSELELLGAHRKPAQIVVPGRV